MESSCIYCGCGCRLNFNVKDNKIISVSGVSSDDVSDGKPCIKGLTIHEVYDKNRIVSPMIKKEGQFKKVTLKEALHYIYEKTKDLAPSDIFFNTSGKITNENNFVIQKFARVCYKTSNIDSCCGRLCHIATVMGMDNIFGVSNLTRMSYLDEIDTLFIFGSEPEKNYPVFYNKLVERKDRIKIIRVHSFIKGCSITDCIVNIVPGSENCLLNGIINELIKRGVKSNIEGFSLLKQMVKDYDEGFVCSTCRISKEDYSKIVDAIYRSKRFGIFHGMGLTQHVNSIENIHSLLNLVLLKDGKILTLRGEINVQGAGDLGGIPGILPTGSLSTKSKLEKVWGPIDVSKGVNILEAFMLSPKKVLFITEFNPFKSLPSLSTLRTKLRDSFIVYFGSFNNETSKMADVIIPIASLLESEGTITNGERRVRKVNKVISGGLELWEVLKEFSLLFGKQDLFNYKSGKDILREIVSLVPSYSKLNVNDIWGGNDGWADKEIKFKRFLPEPFDGLDDIESKEYPFILTTYRSAYAFLGDEVTKNSPTLRRLREKPGIYMNLDDMKSLGLKDGDRVAVVSSEAKVVTEVYGADYLPKGIVGAYIHYNKPLVNRLFPLKFDEESFTPNYKSVAVNIVKLLD